MTNPTEMMCEGCSLVIARLDGTDETMKTAMKRVQEHRSSCPLYARYSALEDLEIIQERLRDEDAVAAVLNKLRHVNLQDAEQVATLREISEGISTLMEALSKLD